MVNVTATSLRTVMSTWYVRVLLGICTIAASIALYVAVSLAGLNTIIGSFLLLLVVAGTGMLTESYRLNGSAAAYGLVLNRQTLWFVGIGAMSAIVMLGILALIAIAFGASFVLQDPGPAADGVVQHIVRLTFGAATEEVLFRGTIFLAIAVRFGGPIAILGSSVVFAVGHAWNPGGVEPLAIVNLFLAGVLLATMIHTKASMFMAISFHAVWNVVTSLIFGNVSGISSSASVASLTTDGVNPTLLWLVSGPFGIEQGFATTCVLLVVIIALNRWDQFDAVVAAARNRTLIAERTHVGVL